MKARYTDVKGYVTILKHDHHFVYSNGTYRENRVVWEQEHYACLLRWADVHHKDQDKQNNVWYNLEAMTHSQHAILHNERTDMSDRKCVECGSTKTHDRNWYKTEGSFRCFICWRRNKRREKKRY